MILSEKHGNVVVVTLNRPEKMNSLHPELMEKFIGLLETIVADISLSVIILTGAGKAFCAGADLGYMLALKDATLEDNSRDVELLSWFFKSVSSCSKPVIAAINGPALAGGCGLALAADYIIADTQTALFGFPEVKRGFIPALVSDILVKRAGEGIARRLLIGGETIPASEAYRIGLIDATSGNPLDDALILAAEWAKNPLVTMQTIKKMLLKLPSLDSDEKEFYLKQQNLHGRYTPEFEKGIQSFLKKR